MTDFSWASAGKIGLGLLQGIGKGEGAAAQAKAANEIRAAQNSVKASGARLANFVRNINNNRLLEAAASRFGAGARTLIRTAEQQTNQGFEQSIRNAEEQGQTQARAALSGLGGSSVEAMSQVVQLAQARAEQYRTSNFEDMTYEQANQLTNVMGDAVKSFDLSPIVPQQDRTQNVSSSLASYLIGGAVGDEKALRTLVGSLADNSPKPQVAEIATGNGRPSLPFNISPPDQGYTIQ